MSEKNQKTLILAIIYIYFTIFQNFEYCVYSIVLIHEGFFSSNSLDLYMYIY